MKKIAVIGECMVELYQNNHNTYTQTFGGDTFNCSVYLQHAIKDAWIEYITVLGQDSLSTAMLNFFHAYQINTSYVDTIADKIPGLFIINTIKGERNFTYWRGQSAAKELFLTQSLKAITTQLLTYDLIYYSAITLAIMRQEGRDNLFNLIQKARKNGVKIAFDSNYRPPLYPSKSIAKQMYTQAISCCDIFLPSMDDEQQLWGKERTVEKIITQAKKAGCQEIIITRGADDIVSYHQDEIRYTKTSHLPSIVDSTSAGDAFHGTYLASRLNGEGVVEAIKKAQKMAAQVIMQQGSIIPTLKKNTK